MSKRQNKRMRPARTRSELRTRRRDLLRRTISIVILLLCWVPMLGGGLQPLWVIPAAVCITMNEDIYFCMAAGVLAGFGMDLSMHSPLGANAIFMVICCTFFCLLFERLLRRSFLHYLVLTAACTLLHSGVRFLLAAVFRTLGREIIWSTVLLPAALLTMIAALPVYLLFLPCAKLLTKRVRSMDAAAIRRDW